MANWLTHLSKIVKYPKKIKIKKEEFLIPSPNQIKKLMQRPKAKKLLSTQQILNYLEKKYKLKVYPKAFKLFLWAIADSQEPSFPFWRTIGPNGELLEEFADKIFLQANFLRKEGHIIIRKGKNLIVKNFQKKLIKL
ncbi:MAG: hypothetical protein N3D10_00550 [Candidatus Micrarchaeota archaeon]|nr:hypothetical protein [Candidatus Micrarchaeota archaeon]